MNGLGALLLAAALSLLTGCSGSGVATPTPLEGQWTSGGTAGGPDLNIILVLEEMEESVNGEATVEEGGVGEFDASVFGIRDGANVELTLELSDGRVWEFSGETRTDPVRMVGTLFQGERDVRVAFERTGT